MRGLMMRNHYVQQERQTDPYRVFSKMLARGCPPDDWEALIKRSHQDFK